ncbi:MAG: formylglycine-generating enzyme family protein [Paracoccaceae bacterium]
MCGQKCAETVRIASRQSCKKNWTPLKLAAPISTLTFCFGFCVSASAEVVLITPPAVRALDVFQDCQACPEMIAMPSGSFMMGAIPGETRNRFDIYGKDATRRVRGPDEVNIIPSEHPRHMVEMDIPFAIARNETTHAAWMACVEDNGCSHVPDHRVYTINGYVALGPDHPVINVSYVDTLDYVAWLNSQVGEPVYRLPTEAEWEYAARSGTATPFAQGDALTADQANFSRAATEHVLGEERPDLTNRRRPVPVGELDAANVWGVRHMSGNVNELTLSCWTEAHLGLSSDSAYLAAAKAQGACRRVAKGGSFGTAMDGVRLARRNRPTEDMMQDSMGFRVVRQIKIEGGN